MIHLFNSESIYIGRDVKQFNDIRTRLEAERIKYKYKVKNRSADWAGIGQGTIRGRTGSIGVPTETMYEYEILVHKKDYDKAVWLIRQK